jgi:hypothetical protein
MKFDAEKLAAIEHTGLALIGNSWTWQWENPSNYRANKISHENRIKTIRDQKISSKEISYTVEIELL